MLGSPVVIKVAQAVGHVGCRLIYHVGDRGDLVVPAVIEQVGVELPLLLD